MNLTNCNSAGIQVGQWKIAAVHTQAAEKKFTSGEKTYGKRKITDQAMYDFYGKMPLKRCDSTWTPACVGDVCRKPDPASYYLRRMRNQWKRVRPSSGLSFTKRDVCSGVVTLVQLYAIGPIGGKSSDHHGE